MPKLNVSFTMQLGLVMVLLIGLIGCGPLFAPMTPRLEPEQQHAVDQMWNNMLTPVQRVDRQTLLDANVAFWMFTFGVDRLHMTSEKYFNGGTVVMEIDCDRANPVADQFTITVLDEQGRTIRLERYTRAEVEESEQMMNGMPNFYSGNNQAQITIVIGKPTTQPSTQPATQSVTMQLTPKERKFLQEAERRQAAAAAATQPAR